MKFISVMITIIVLSGCSSMKPVETPPDQLHERIAARDVVIQGDKVKIVTTDGKTHLADIVAIETREFSDGKIAALTGGMFPVHAFLAASAAASFTMGY